MKRAEIICILLIAILVFSPQTLLRAQDVSCSPGIVLEAFTRAASFGNVEEWRQEFANSDCPRHIMSAVQTLAQAYDQLVSASEINLAPCSYSIALSSFQAAVASDELILWEQQYVQSQCSNTFKDGIKTLVKAHSLLTLSSSVLPSSAVIVGTFQTRLGCTQDWDPSCSKSFLIYDAINDVWWAEWQIPAGDYEYKVALNGSLEENYGDYAEAGGGNVSLRLSEPTQVKFIYDWRTHWVADNVSSLIANVPGDFQNEIGCSNDWQPDCLRTWLQDPDRDGIYVYITTAIPAGSYEAKVALNESWEPENYGADRVEHGNNIPFNVPADYVQMTFGFDTSTKLLTITANESIVGDPFENVVNLAVLNLPQPNLVVIPSTFQLILGCARDWQPDCTTTALSFASDEAVWRGSFELPAGSYEYKIAIEGSWEENYGLGGEARGPNIPLNIPQVMTVHFCYNHASHQIYDSINDPAIFDREFGCP